MATKAWRDDIDYSVEIEKAKAQGLDTTQLEKERAAKIADKYGGKEPTMYGSNQTYSQASAAGNTGAIGNAVGMYNQYSGGSSAGSSTDPYAGTNYHQNAIDAAIAGDWDAVTNYLGQREQKVAAQGGDNRGKTSAEIYAELWEQYGTPIPAASGGTGFTYDYDSKPTYESKYDSSIDELLNQILNRDAFSYNAAEDDLYKQYATMYEREGTRAMNDAMASAAATAGGMNSYAMTAANQANNYYMSQLNDKIPELYQLAYDMYLQDIDNQVRDLGLLQGMDDTQYGRYRDTMSDWYNDRDFAYNKYRDDVGDYWQQKEFDNSNSKWQQEFDHMVSQDALAQQNRDQEWAWETGQTTGNTAYNKAMEILNSGAMPTADMLKAAGMTEQQASAILAAVKAEQAAALGGSAGSTGSTGSTGSSGGSGYTGSNSSTGSGYNNSGVDPADIKKMQKALGVTADGLWGSKSQEAAKAAGWSTNAKEAWAAYSGGGDPGTSNGNGYVSVADLNKETNGSITGIKSYDDATAYLNRYSIPAADIAGLMTKTEWTRRKASLNSYGQGGAEVTAYDSYSDYLVAFVQYLMEKNGK